MTEMNKNKKAMSAQELEKVSGGKILPRRVNFPEKLPINFPRFGAGRSTDEGIHYRFPLISKVTTISPIVW